MLFIVHKYLGGLLGEQLLVVGEALPEVVLLRGQGRHAVLRRFFVFIYVVARCLSI